MNKQKALDIIAKDIENCKACKVGKVGNAVPGEGDADADVVFVGEAPGKKEAETGRPFIGRSGQLLRALIREIGLKEEDVFITSPVKYLPAGRQGLPGGTPTPKDIAHGRVHFLKQLKVIDPKVIVLLGSVAVQAVLEEKLPITKFHGQIIERAMFGNKKVNVLLTFHPAAALRFPNKFKHALQGDFRKIKELIDF